jgi:hypothetical protein
MDGELELGWVGFGLFVHLKEAQNLVKLGSCVVVIPNCIA